MKFFCICMSLALDATVRLPRASKGEGRDVHHRRAGTGEEPLEREYLTDWKT